MRTPVIVDGRRFFDPETAVTLGFPTKASAPRMDDLARLCPSTHRILWDTFPDKEDGRFVDAIN